MLRRHPILCSLVLLLLLAIAAGGIFLLRFDLDHYRSDLEQGLAAALGKPVRLGRAHFAFSHGISLQFDEVRIGTDTATGLIEAEQLALRLELAPLFRRRLNFDRLYLDRPVLHLPLTTDRTATAGDGKLQRSLQYLQDIARSTRVRSLLIHQGSVIVSDDQAPQPRQWSLDQLDLLVTNLALQHPVDLSATARLSVNGSSTPLSLTGTVTLPESAEAWPQTSLQLRLSAKNYAPAPWLASWLGSSSPLTVSGEGDILLDLSGTPAGGLALRANLIGRELALTVPEWYRSPLPVRQLQLSGTWTSGPLHRISDLVCDWDGLRLSGSIALPTEGGLAGAEAELQLARTPLTRLPPLIPDRPAPQFVDGLHQQLRDGTLENLRLSLHWPESGSTDPLQVVRSGEFQLREGAFELPRLGLLRGVNLDGSWQDGVLSLRNGRGTLTAGTLNFDGEARFAAGMPVRLQLQANGLLDAAGAILLLPLPPESRQVAAGEAPVTFTASGTSDHLSLNLQADLRKIGLSLYGETLKAAGDPGDLFAVAEVGAGIFDLGLARLTLPAGEMHIGGRIFLDPPHAFRLALDLSRLDLDQLTRHDSVARVLRVSGEAALHLDLTGDAQGATQREGWIDVRNLSMHFADAVADLNRAGGRIRLEQDRAVIEHARGYVGTSVLTGTGSLELAKGFRLTLDISGESLLASDLVFPSDRLRLNDLRGHLVIDAQGILFEQVSTRLGSGTRAVVNGQLIDYHHPHLELAIAAEEANIADILDLWQRPSASNPYKHAGSGSGNAITVRIEGQVQRGNLFGLPFRNGQGIITARDGMLVVQPVQLETGSGFCRGQAVLRELAAEAPLLTLTGHVENADASAVYNQMLGRRGLVSGRLSGDFAIEGRLGSTFLPTSFGGFSLLIERGELREFPVLSKVFSLLNVSQIFALRLPDLTAEGMPFRQLRATIRMQQGTLRTEDLVVDSDAMNLALVGDFDLPRNRLDLILGIKPLATVDKVVSHIPLAGWILTGQNKALITAQFRVQGSGDNPKVDAIPITSVSDTVVGIFKRLFGLPAKVIGDVQDLVEGEKK